VQPTKTPYDVAVANERLVSHAGVGLLAELADRLGLTAALEHKPPHPSLAPFKPFGDSAWSSRPGLLACRPCGLIVRSMGRAEMATFYRSIRPIREGIHRLEDVVGDRTLIASRASSMAVSSTARRWPYDLRTFSGSAMVWSSSATRTSMLRGSDRRARAALLGGSGRLAAHDCDLFR
jgi:hypothetical protein